VLNLDLPGSLGVSKADENTEAIKDVFRAGVWVVFPASWSGTDASHTSALNTS